MALSDAQTDRIFDGILTRLENKLSRLIAGNFRQLSLLIAQVIENGGEIAGDIVINANQKELEKILQDAYFDAIREGMKFTYRDLEEEEPEDDYAALLLLLFGWVTLTAAQHAKFLTDTSIGIFDEIYQEAIESGKLGEELAKSVARDMAKRNRGRVKIISTTEANMAFQTGALEAGKSLSDQLLKRWVSQQDSRVRPTHRRANTRYKLKPIPLGRDFQVGLGHGSRPLDPSLPSAELVGCRCYLRFVKPKIITP
jgi:hypothetical protein